jgi:hypothetical protein
MKRKCWFLADADTLRAAAQPSKQRKQVATIRQDPDITASGDARAELVERNETGRQLCRVTSRNRNRCQTNSTALGPASRLLLSVGRCAAEALSPPDPWRRPTVLTKRWLSFPALALPSPKMPSKARCLWRGDFLRVLGGGIVIAFASWRRGRQPFSELDWAEWLWQHRFFGAVGSADAPMRLVGEATTKSASNHPLLLILTRRGRSAGGARGPGTSGPHATAARQDWRAFIGSASQ